MKLKRNKRTGGLVMIGLAVVMLSPALQAGDPGLNQPGVRGNVGVGAPGAGVRDPGLNQPGAVGNTGPARRSVRR